MNLGKDENARRRPPAPTGLNNAPPMPAPPQGDKGPMGKRIPKTADSRSAGSSDPLTAGSSKDAQATKQQPKQQQAKVIFTGLYTLRHLHIRILRVLKELKPQHA